MMFGTYLHMKFKLQETSINPAAIGAALAAPCHLRLEVLGRPFDLK